MFSSRIFTRKKEKKSKLEELYDTYGSFIYYTALKYLGDGHLAQDCTQQSMERLMKYADRLGETEAKETKSYIYRLTVSTALNMKKQQDQYVAKEDEELIYLVDSASQEDEIERVFREADSREALRQAMEHLSEEEKILLAERYGRERSFAEIAELLNISESACRKRLQRTKAHLAALLDPQSRSDQRRKAETRKGGEYHDGQDAKS